MKDQNISRTVQDLLEETGEELASPKPFSNCCSQIRVSSLIPCHQLLPQKKRVAEQVSGDWKTETNHTRRVTLPAVSIAMMDLLSGRVQRLHVKKPTDLLKDMIQSEKNTVKNMNKKIFNRTQYSQQDQAKSDQDQLWRDLLKPQEERAFQIDRTIR